MAAPTGSGSVLTKNVIGIITAGVIAGMTALVGFTYKMSSETTALSVSMQQLSKQLDRLDAKIELISTNYTSKSQFDLLENRVRDSERDIVEIKARQKR